MRIGFQVQYAGDPVATTGHVQRMEAAGLDIVWVAEAYGFDAPSILGYLAAKTDNLALGSAILNVYSRTPALIAQVAAGLDTVCDGRFELGLGASGPQVIEGWHGMPYSKPLTRTAETIELVRRMLRREVIEYQGDVFTLPLPADQGTGLGKPLKMLTHPVRSDIPIHVAALGPKNVEMTAELANGWIPIFFHPERFRDVWGGPLEAGLSKRDASLGELDTIIAVGFAVAEGDHRTALLDASRAMYALYIGGMGARDKNFYNNVFQRYGYEAEAAEIQDLFLAGKKEEAAAKVPADFLRDTAMVGDEGFVRDRIKAYKEAGVTRLSITPVGENKIELVEKVRSWIDD
jgi:F420-dependent oxidoreductase-like protein